MASVSLDRPGGGVPDVPHCVGLHGDGGGSGLFGFGTAAEAALAPLQLATFLFTVLFLILLILGSRTFKNLV